MSHSREQSESAGSAAVRQPSPEREIIRYAGSPEDRAEHWMRRLPFPEKYDYVSDPETPDLVAVGENWDISPHSFRRRALYRTVLKYHRRHGGKPVIFHVTGEAGRPSADVDFSFSYHPANRKNCLRSFVLDDYVMQSLWREAPDEYGKRLRNTEKTRFCCFIYSDSSWRARVRRRFCRLLSQYKPVDCPGASLNNMPRIARRGHKPRWEFMAQCKFSIAFEHSSMEHYLTEKLADALYAGAVPVYWGSPRAAEYYNPAAFINCHDFRSFEEVVQRVMEVDQNPGLYEEYRNAPPILPQSRFYVMQRESEAHCAAIVEEALARRERKTDVLQRTLRRGGILLRNLPLELWCAVYSLFPVRFLKTRLRRLLDPSAS